jgi:hypothetical protein
MTEIPRLRDLLRHADNDGTLFTPLPNIIKQDNAKRVFPVWTLILTLVGVIISFILVCITEQNAWIAVFAFGYVLPHFSRIGMKLDSQISESTFKDLEEKRVTATEKILTSRDNKG